MTRRVRLLLGALAISIALHLAFVFGIPDFSFDAPEPPPPPLDARLVMREPEPEPAREPPKVEAPPPALPKPRPAARKRAIVAAPAEPAAVAPSTAPPPPAPESAAPVTVESESAAPPSPPEEPAVAYPVRRARLVYDLLLSESKTRIGVVTHTWSAAEGRYEVESVAEAVGFVSWIFGGRFVQRSRGIVGPRGLVPEEYSLHRGRSDPPEVAQFDWENQKLALAWRKEHRVVDLPPGTQDPLSVVHQIYFMQPLPATSALSVATGRKLNRYRYEVLGDADLETPLGLLQTLHIGRVESDGSVLELWLDRNRSLLPVRIYSIDSKGTILDQVLRDVALLE